MVPVEGHWVTRLTSTDLSLWSPEGRIIVLDASASVIARDRVGGPLRYHRSDVWRLLQSRWMAGCGLQVRTELGRILRGITTEGWKALVDIHDQEVVTLAE